MSGPCDYFEPNNNNNSKSKITETAIPEKYSRLNFTYYFSIYINKILSMEQKYLNYVHNVLYMLYSMIKNSSAM